MNIYRYLIGSGAAAAPAGAVSLQPGLAFRLGNEAIARAATQALPPIVADLVDVSYGILAADRHSLRRSGTPGVWGRRRIHATLAVRHCDLWTQSSVRNALEELLIAATGDLEWSLTFCPRNTPRTTAETQGFLISAPPFTPDVVTLLSGGIDSFAGLAGLVADQKQCIAVTAQLQPGLHSPKGRVGRALGAFQGDSATRIFHAPVPVNLLNAPPRHLLEDSQRTRTFFFLSLGAVFAYLFGTETVCLHENGIGSFNMPVSHTWPPSQASRASHPEILKRIALFLSMVLHRRIAIHNPLQLSTKAEAVRSLAFGRLREAIPDLSSCPRKHYLRGSRVLECGTCPACILRRQSLWSAGFSEFDNPATYCRDIFDPRFAADGRDQAGAQSYYLRETLAVLHRLRDNLAASDAMVRLSIADPQLAPGIDAVALGTGRTRQDVEAAVLSLYSRYVDEWDLLLRSLQEHRQGEHWSHWWSRAADLPGNREDH